MSIVKKIRTWLGVDQDREERIQQAQVMSEIVTAIKELKQEKAVQPKLPSDAKVEEDDVSLSTLKVVNAELQKQLEIFQKQVENLQKQLTTAKEDGVRTLFADFKKSQEEKKEKQEKAGRPRIDGKFINLRVDIDTYNMLQFLASRKVLQKTRYINEKLRKCLMEDIQSDPVFGSLYNEFTKTEKIQENE